MILFHYTSGQGLFGILNSRKLHCSNVSFLNDPSEQIYFSEILNSVRNSSLTCIKIYEELYNQSYYEVILNRTSKFIASFSKNTDSLSMWNYYSKGNGYNIGLDIDSILKRNNSLKTFIQKVELIYDRSEQIKLATDYILSFKDKLKMVLALEKERENHDSQFNYFQIDLKINEIQEEFTDGIFELILKFKHEAYKNEEEVRLIISHDEPNQDLIDFKISESGVFIEFIKLDLDIKRDFKNIKTHPLSNELHLQGLNNFLINKFNHYDLKTSKSQIPFRVI